MKWSIILKIRHLANFNPAYFSRLIPSNECRRMFPDFRTSTGYLDIETTGLACYFNDITILALFDGQSIQTYVQGQNLDDFIEDIQRYKVIDSYNGKSRDTPFYESHCIRESTPPSNPFKVDLTTVDRIKNSSQCWSSQQW